jgi:UDP-3-O-[3-hydroxymyristoyl] N-acetylglucosamine deacetylase
MGSWNQRTVAKRVSCTGVGLHSGKPATLTFAPAPADAGITFVRMDLGVEIPARSANVADTTLSTTISHGRAKVATVEHVVAALAGLGVDNCRVEIDGPEIPILDGSAAPFVYLVQEAGIVTQRAGKRFLVLQSPVEIRDGDKFARLDPAPEFSIRFTVDFDHPLITNQTCDFTFSDRRFARELAPARTFCFLRDIEVMRARGLALGGSLDNAVVIDEFSILNPEGLRFPDEFARHKALDAIGDLALCGAPIIGALTARKSGHAMNQALVRKVLADPACHRLVRVTAEHQLEPLRIRLPALGVADAA